MMIQPAQPQTPGMLLLLLSLRRRRMIVLQPAAPLLWAALPACNLVVSRANTDACCKQHVHLSPLSSSGNEWAGGTFGMRPCVAWAPGSFFKLGRNHAACSSRVLIRMFHICYSLPVLP